MNINLILLIGALLLGFFILSQCVGNSSTEVPEHEHSHGSRRQQYRVNRTRGDWNNLRQGGRSNRKLRELRKDSFGQNRYWDEIYPNYFDKTVVYTSDYFPWWRNSNFWPYYTRSYNWMQRYPYYSYWRRPYYYNYWASPYYPSRTVLVKPYVKNMELKGDMQQQMTDNFQKARVTA